MGREEKSASMSDREIYINGIQQVGIGCSNAPKTFAWYNRYLGFDIKVFEDIATASLMTEYTGGQAHDRHAYLSMNMRGGGGLEIWQFTSRVPQQASSVLYLGDLGINYIKVRSADIETSRRSLQSAGCAWLGDLTHDPFGRRSFFFKDPWSNLVQVVSDPYTYTEVRSSFGGVMGVAIGVSDCQRSTDFYSRVLGYDKVSIVDKVPSRQEDFKALSGECDDFARLKLTPTTPAKGGFSPLLGPTEVELIKNHSREGRPVYRDRFWGDLGYIHACFDVSGMSALRSKAQRLGYPFTVDSADSFDMGEAAGHFAYVEDPDGTLIELVETHRVPIIKALGWSIDLKKRESSRPLPDWLIKAMRIHRVKAEG